MTTSTSEQLKQRLAKRWLGLAVCMLAASGIFSLIIVFARTPGLYDIPYVKKLFGEALVIHVDLLVVAWPLCIAAMMWAAFCPSKLQPAKQHFLNKIGVLLVAGGALLLVVSPLDFAAEPLKNNYVPIITTDIFLTGLLAMAAGAALLAIHALFCTKRDRLSDFGFHATLNWGARGAAIIVLFSLVAFYLGFAQTSPEGIDAEHYYESAIWAGGHIFQFAFTQIQMIAWLWIFHKLTEGTRGVSQDSATSYQWVRAIFLCNAAIGSVGIYGILTFDTLSFQYNQFYTRHMIIGGGIAPILFLLWMTRAWFKIRRVNQDSKPMAGATGMKYLRSALFVSIGLFLYGGLLGLLIQGQDVTIPAHYHGSTISVTIALMGFAYAYLPNVTARKIPTKLIKWQPIVYGVGQFMHITGLAVSGGYGVLRKTPGLDEGFSQAKFALGFMGAGGLLAVIGGLLFVYIMWVCFRSPST